MRAGTQRQVAHCLAAAVVDIVGGPASAAKWTQLGPRAPPDAPDGVAFSGWTPVGPPKPLEWAPRPGPAGVGGSSQGRTRRCLHHPAPTAASPATARAARRLVGRTDAPKAADRTHRPGQKHPSFQGGQAGRRATQPPRRGMSSMRPKQGSWDHTFWSHGGDDQKITRVRDLFALFLISRSPERKSRRIRRSPPTALACPAQLCVAKNNMRAPPPPPPPPPMRFDGERVSRSHSASATALRPGQPQGGPGPLKFIPGVGDDASSHATHRIGPTA